MSSAFVAKNVDAEAAPLPPRGILRWLIAIGLVAPRIKPASGADLHDRIESLATRRLRALKLPPDIMALYIARNHSSAALITATWLTVVGILNMSNVIFDVWMIPPISALPVFYITLSHSVVFLLCGQLVRQRRLRGVANLLILIPCVLTVAMAGSVGILSLSADIFRSNITMSILVVYTAIVFTDIDRKASIWLVVLTMLTLAGVVAISPIHNEAEKIQMVALFGVVLAVIIYGKHIQDIYRHRVFVLQMRDELRNQEAVRRNEQLSSIAFTDRLTGIPNRRYFDEIAETINAGPEQVLPLAICMLDIDHFKNLNDELGHLQGDRCLRVVAMTIRNHLRQKGDILARFGGEEFVLLLPNTDETVAREIAERVREAVFSLNHPNPGTMLGRVSISAGLAVAGTAGAVAGLLQEADRALYRAKAGGRNRVEV